jgi:hypothetical protein
MERFTIRSSTAADQRRLEELAELDCAHLAAGPYLLAEVDGELRAALCVDDCSTIADPLCKTTHLVALLELVVAVPADVDVLGQRRPDGWRARARGWVTQRVARRCGKRKALGDA